MSKSKTVSWFLCLLLTSLSILFPGYSAAKDITVGAIYLDTQGYYAGVRQGVQDAAKSTDAKIQLIETNAQGDISKESSFIDTLVARNVDASFYPPFQKMAVAARCAGPMKRVFR